MARRWKSCCITAAGSRPTRRAAAVAALSSEVLRRRGAAPNEARDRSGSADSSRWLLRSSGWARGRWRGGKRPGGASECRSPPEAMSTSTGEISTPTASTLPEICRLAGEAAEWWLPRRDAIFGCFERVRDLTRGACGASPTISSPTEASHGGVFTRVTADRDDRHLDVVLAQAYQIGTNGKPAKNGPWPMTRTRSTPSGRSGMDGYKWTQCLEASND